jgi:hypothetical protein
MNQPEQACESVWRRIPALGMLALAAFVICAVTGILLVPAYKPDAALDSLALLLLKNPAGIFVRSLHYWSAQAFLVLTLAHVAEHMLRRSETKVTFGVWWRLSLTVPVAMAAMLSGFLLRGDGPATQALQVLRSLLGLLPGLGAPMARMLTGSGADLQTIYLHHACTATIVIWLITIEHARRILPSAKAVAWTAPPVLALAAFLVPWLESRTQPIEKGPWYFVGLQELLHWLPWPQIAVWLALPGLALLVLLPVFSSGVRKQIKWALTGAVVAYAVLTVVGVALRGEGWKLASPAAVWAGEPHFASWQAWLPVEAKLVAIPVPVVSGQREGCLACHTGMTGFVAAHDPKTVGCVSCHLGNPFTLNKTLAHGGMTLTPGNLSVVNRTCGESNCHAEISTRVRSSLMNSMSGVVAVDKFAFGESADLDAHFDVGTLKHSPADTHLRQLCAACHLGQDKPDPAAIGDASRGGGCSACHLRYDRDAAEELSRRIGPSVPTHHPDISTHVAKDACFGCHSRSGRISTNYEGWHETQLDVAAAKGKPGWPDQFRVLTDGRVFEKNPADVHFEKGMICVDCHIAAEVMSDGAAHAHEGDAVKISCQDCHAVGATPAEEFNQLDGETQQIAAMRNLNEPGRRFVIAQSGTAAYANVFLGTDGRPRTILMESGQILQPKPAAAVCSRAGSIHERLTCDACHAAWAPQCVTCHTTFDRNGQGWDYLAGRYVKGTWQEDAGDLEGDAPALGVERATTPDGRSAERITTFAPGMIMDFEWPAGGKQRRRFLRLFAPVSPHTTASKARDCRSCHANPAALGYGRGKLTYVVTGNVGEWQFTPAHGASQADGLPADAWIGFLREPRAGTTIRKGARPFNLQEQREILLVGACLACHSEKEPRVAAAFANFKSYRATLSAQCRLPSWADSNFDKQVARIGAKP